MWFGCAGRNYKQTLAARDIGNWVCVYNENASTEAIKNFDLAVLDADAHPDLSALKNSRTILIGYVSLGEVGDYRWFWPQMAGKPWVLDKNPNWNSYFVDVRAPEWHDLLLDKIIPKILEDGFDGLFLDTVDNAEYLEKYHPVKKYPGSQAAMIQLIRKMRLRFPDIHIIANRGFAILEQIAGDIDGVVAESVFTTVDFENEGKMRILRTEEYTVNLRRLMAVKNRSKIKVFTLDYLEKHKEREISRLISKSREFGFIPYVSTPRLDGIYLNTLRTATESSTW